MGARRDLTNAEWERLEPLLPTREGKQGRPYVDHRRILNGMLWVMRTGAPWRDMPERYGSWRTVYSRFRRWTQAGVFDRIEQQLQAEEDAKGNIDWSSCALDGSYVKVHPHAVGARKKGARRNKAGSVKRSARAGVV